MGADPTQVDTGHYTLEMENDVVRVLRVRYGPGEKSVMHGHPAHLAIALNTCNLRMTFPDGTSEEMTLEAGKVIEAPSGDHCPENLGDEPFEAILVELKGKE